MEFRTAYDGKNDEVSEETGLACLDLSLAVQSQRDDADINVIVKRFGLTGKLPENVRMPTYGDFTGLTDFRDALHAVMQAEDSFMAMPADIRRRFGNDPAAFVDFCSDPANIDELRRLGLAVPAKEKADVSVEKSGGAGVGAEKAPGSDSGGGSR